MSGLSSVCAPADVGRAIKVARASLGMSQQALARELGTSRQWVVRLEKHPGAQRISKVLKALDAVGLEMVCGNVAVKEPVG